MATPKEIREVKNKSFIEKVIEAKSIDKRKKEY